MEVVTLQWGYLALPCMAMGGLGYVLVDSLDYDPSKPVSNLAELHALLETFNFEDSLLSNWEAPIFGGLSYLALIFFLQWVMGRAISRNGLSKVSTNYEAICSVQCLHNTWLCIWSLVMCTGCAWSCYERYKVEGSWVGIVLRGETNSLCLPSPSLPPLLARRQL